MRVVTCWCSRPVLVDWGIRGGGAQVYRETSSVVPIHGQIAGTPYLTTWRNDARTTNIPASGKGGASEIGRSVAIMSRWTRAWAYRMHIVVM